MSVRSSECGVRSQAKLTNFHFQNLSVYQKSLALIDETYELTRRFPADERFGLIDQFRRGAISITLNIAEGSGRTKKDFNHFLRNARASCYECVAILDVASRRSYVTAEQQTHDMELLTDLAKMISGLMRSLGGATQ